MMRKNTLRQTANRYLQLDNQGSYRERKQRAYVLHKMIDDLFRIGAVPKSWQTIKAEQIHSLVAYWKQIHIKDATIMRHMTIIRKYFLDMSCFIPDIDNQSLQLTRQRHKSQNSKWPPNIWEIFTDSTPKLIMALQTQFGLTFSEAIQIKANIHIKTHKLWITREIAFNSTDRIIPIRNEAQKEILSDLNQATQDSSLIQHLGYKKILLDWQYSLAKQNLPAKKSWRYLYAKSMYEYLYPILGNYKTYLVLQDELGIKSRNTLWTYLHE